MKTIEIPAQEWNSEKGKMEETSLPEWQEYYRRLKAHEEFYDDYKFYLDRILRHLNFLRVDHAWTTDEIRSRMSAEIDMAMSCDAPNKPGYYRANND